MKNIYIKLGKYGFQTTYRAFEKPIENKNKPCIVVFDKESFKKNQIIIIKIVKMIMIVIMVIHLFCINTIEIHITGIIGSNDNIISKNFKRYLLCNKIGTN